MSQVPKRLSLTDEGDLQIEWSDGTSRHYSARELYAVNPAADARAAREKEEADRTAGSAKVGNLMLSVIKPEEAQPRRIVGVRPVGNYAYSIKFNHGSSAGLYRLELLRELGTDCTTAPKGSSDGQSNE